MDVEDGAGLERAIRGQRERLEELQEWLLLDGGSLGPEDAHKLLDSTIDDLREIERWVQAGRHRAFPRLRQKVARVRGLSKPRIGRLRHYPPKRLEVPASYLTTPLPERAPTISIVTPSFQHGRFLERTVRSVLDQGYPALEYFVQDGGSTDGTLAVLERCDAELDGWVSERDSGQAGAINRAFARTSGEIMAWLNSDDLLLPGSLAYVGAYFADHPEVDVVYGNRIMIDDHDGQVGTWILPEHDDLALTLADYVPQETLFWRRRIWDAAGGLDPSFGYALDWDLLLRFRSAGATMVRLPRFIGAFRIHDEQKTSSARPLGQRRDGTSPRAHARSPRPARRGERSAPALLPPPRRPPPPPADPRSAPAGPSARARRAAARAEYRWIRRVASARAGFRDPAFRRRRVGAPRSAG